VFSDKVLRPTPSFEPLVLKAVRLNHLRLRSPNYLCDDGTSQWTGTEYRDEVQKVIDYFWESASVESENWWVKFSPYESNLMLPEVLSGTRLGADLLDIDLQAQDLRRIVTASR